MDFLYEEVQIHLHASWNTLSIYKMLIQKADSATFKYLQTRLWEDNYFMTLFPIVNFSFFIYPRNKSYSLEKIKDSLPSPTHRL